MALSTRLSLVTLLGAGLLACAGESRPLELRVGLDPAATGFGEVEVWGLPPLVRRALARIPADDARWARALAVQASAEGGAVPTLAGRYGIDEHGCLKFSPRFPPEGPLSYRVRLDPRALATLAGRPPGGDTVRQWSFRLPGRPTPPATTTITAVYPSAPVVPANQLRWYLEFSGPMREGEALAMVQLLDGAGRVVDGAFLRREEELWNRDRTRLTLLFDMARVKHDIRRRREVGPVLRAGKAYQLRVSTGWHDARGATLARGLSHAFRAGPEDRAPLRPADWALEPPAIGTRAPLELRFGKPLDHALASQLIAVIDGQGLRMPGRVILEDHDRRWQFVPDEPWYAGRYAVEVNPALEDIAGNRVGRPFDADLRQEERAGVGETPVRLGFAPIGELSLREPLRPDSRTR
ncbi:MAG TPA: hypothetical protein VG692_18855 [Gemmatimonadales bacterium]|nr:hypothetical protein [Gemmatimonadales bacterium]